MLVREGEKGKEEGEEEVVVVVLSFQSFYLWLPSHALLRGEGRGRGGVGHSNYGTERRRLYYLMWEDRWVGVGTERGHVITWNMIK